MVLRFRSTRVRSGGWLGIGFLLHAPSAALLKRPFLKEMALQSALRGAAGVKPTLFEV
jgi:hypothetical protein